MGGGLVGCANVTSLPTNDWATATEKSCAPAATVKNKYRYADVYIPTLLYR